jgi:hypothetical protein
MENRKRQFIHFSIRIPINVKDELESEAELQKTNLNSLINQILAKHVSFDRIANHMKVMPLNQYLFSGMLDNVPLEAIEAIGKELGPRNVKRTFAVLGFNYDLDHLIQSYFQPVSSYSGWYTFNIVGKGSDRKLVFEHSHGPKWSAFLKYLCWRHNKRSYRNRTQNRNRRRPSTRLLLVNRVGRSAQIHYLVILPYFRGPLPGLLVGRRENLSFVEVLEDCSYISSRSTVVHV